MPDSNEEVLSDDAEFDTAFDESVAGDSAGPTDVVETIESTVDEDQDVAGQDGIEADQSNAGEDDSQKDEKVAPAEQASALDQDGEKAESESERVRKLTSKIRSGKGRLAAFNDDLIATQRELDELTGIDSSASQNTDEALPDIKGMTDEEFEEFKEDYPVFAKQFEAMGGQLKTLSDRLEKTELVGNQIEQREMVDARTTFDAPILEAHSDYHQILDKPDDFLKFVDAQSPLQKRIYNEIVDSGSPEEIIDLIGEYKSTDHYSGHIQKQDSGSNTAIQSDIDAASAIPSKSGVPIEKKGRPSKNDFDGGWDEASID